VFRAWNPELGLFAFRLGGRSYICNDKPVDITRWYQ